MISILIGAVTVYWMRRYFRAEREWTLTVRHGVSTTLLEDLEISELKLKIESGRFEWIDVKEPAHQDHTFKA